MVSSVSDFPTATADVARRLYEESGLPLTEVAARLGISRYALARRARRLGWQRADAAPPSRRQLISRLVVRIEAEIAAVERLIARAGIGGDAAGIADTERAARTLAVLVRSLRELAALERGEEDDEAEDQEEETVRDAGAYRRELAATLERVLADRAA